LEQNQMLKLLKYQM